MSFQSQIDDILTNHSSDAPEELERKLAVYDINDIVAVVAKRAATGGGGGGGGFTPVSVSLQKFSLDVHPASPGNHPVMWDRIIDDLWNQDVLDAIPDGLGMDFAFDGSSSDITTTEAGVWSISLWARGNARDAAWRGDIQIPFIEFSTGFDFVDSQYGAQLSVVSSLPSDITDEFLISTFEESTADPFTVTMEATIVRLG